MGHPERQGGKVQEFAAPEEGDEEPSGEEKGGGGDGDDLLRLPLRRGEEKEDKRDGPDLQEGAEGFGQGNCQRKEDQRRDADPPPFPTKGPEEQEGEEDRQEPGELCGKGEERLEPDLVGLEENHPAHIRVQPLQGCQGLRVPGEEEEGVDEGVRDMEEKEGEKVPGKLPQGDPEGGVEAGEKEENPEEEREEEGEKERGTGEGEGRPKGEKEEERLPSPERFHPRRSQEVEG